MLSLQQYFFFLRQLISAICFFFSCGPTLQGDMVSRRRILSRSRDDLNLELGPAFQQQEEEEDVWYNKDKLYKVSQQFIIITDKRDNSFIERLCIINRVTL